jgi:hypothetical protein
MLVYGIKLSIITAISIMMAAAFNRRMFFFGIGRRAVLFWLFSLPIAFWMNNELIMLLGCLALLVVFNKGHSPIYSAIFFIIAIGAVPDWIEYRLSAPGINYLFLLTYDRVAVIVLLLPLFFSLKSISKIPWSITDTLVTLFVAYMAILTFREGKVTNVTRFLVESFLIYIIPYFVFTRVVKSIKDLHYCALAFLILSILLTAVLIISQIIQLDIYEALNPRSRYNIIREYRGGFLRLSGSLVGILVGFILLAGYFSLDILKKYGVIPRILYWPTILAFVMAILFTGSRGALFGVVMGVAIYFYFVKLTNVKRTICAVSIVLLFMCEVLFDVSSMFVYEDQYGTFDYRSELYQASWEYMKHYPLFGQQFYIDTGYFNHLVTGLGIIDIVSAYLGVALQYGYVGLVIYVAMLLSVVIPLGRRLLLVSSFDGEYEKYLAMYFVLNVVMMFMISTTSAVSSFPIFIMISLAIGRVLLSNEKIKATV